MRLVGQAVTYPSRCAVLPHLGGSHPGGYIDTASELANGGDGRWDFHVYVSVVAARMMGELIGMVDPAELQARVLELEARASSAEADLAEANRQLDAIDVLESADFTRRRKPGRPPKQREEVAA